MSAHAMTGRRGWVRRCGSPGILAVASSLWLGLVAPHHADARGSAVVDAPIAYRAWSIGAGFSGDELHASQFAAPVTFQARLGARADLTTSISAAASSLEPGSGSTVRLDGASSLMSQLSVRFAGDRAMLQTGMTLPTGTHALGAGEVGVWEVANLPVLGFPLRHYGRGFEWNGGLVVARHMGEGGSASLGFGTVLRAPYELISGHEGYRPASEVSVTTGFDLRARGAGSGPPPLRVDLTYRWLGTHREDGRQVLREGNQLEVQASGALESRSFVGGAFVRVVAKGDYLPYDSTGRAIDRLQGSSGTSVSTRATCARRLGATRRVGLAGEWNLLRDSDGFAHDGHAYAAGPFLDTPLGPILGVHLEATRLWGSLDRGADGEPIALHGASVSASLRWGAAE